ncbi:MAG: hypothetical protein KJ584_04840 [Candidatus Omnitrophica bacterium]|nr:hypothetical protein [Candidatus Omnitrophota bacterium]
MKRITILSAFIVIILFTRTAVMAQETAGSDAQKSAKTKNAISWQSIGQKMKEYKGILKEIVSDAEKSLKKMEEESKARESEKAMKEAAKKANAEAIKKAAKKAAKKKAADEVVVKAKKAAEKKAAKEAIAKAKKAEKEAAAKAKKAEKEAIAKAKKAEKEAAAQAKKAEKEAAAQAKKAARQKATDEAAAKAAREIERKRSEEAAIMAKSASRLKITEPTQEPRLLPATRRPVKKPRAVREVKKESSASTAKSSVDARRLTPTELVIIPVTHVRKRHLIDRPSPEAQMIVASEEVSAIYRDAVALYWDNKYSDAKAKFEQVQKALPEYARTSYYLRRVKEKLSK